VIEKIFLKLAAAEVSMQNDRTVCDGKISEFDIVRVVSQLFVCFVGRVSHKRVMAAVWRGTMRLVGIWCERKWR
jgi:hypothetical protein